MVTSDLIPWHYLFSSFSDPDCLQLVILFQSDLPTHTHTHETDLNPDLNGRNYSN
jgi:hypothetical protein